MKIHLYIAIFLAITLTNIQFSRGRPDGGCNGGYKDGVCCNDGECAYFGGRIDGPIWDQNRERLEKPYKTKFYENPCAIANCAYNQECSDRCYEKMCSKEKFKAACAFNDLFNVLGTAVGPLG